jgi:hypothetical protein
MKTKFVLPLFALIALALAACGGSSSNLDKINGK